MGGKSCVHAAGGAHRAPRAHRLVCSGARSTHRAGRPDLAHRRRGRSCGRALDVYGRDDRERGDPAQRHRPKPGPRGRGRAHVHVRWPRARLGDRAAPCREEPQQALRHALAGDDAARARIQGSGERRLDAVEHKDTVVFLHAVEEGPASRSYGLQVAGLAGDAAASPAGRPSAPRRIEACARQPARPLRARKKPSPSPRSIRCARRCRA